MANPNNSLRAIAWAVVMAVAIVAGAGTARAQCTGNFHVAGFPEGGTCFYVSFPPCYEISGTNYLTFPANGTYARALCCAPDPGHYLSLLVAGTPVGAGESRTITTECGCVDASVGLPDAGGVVDVYLTLLKAGSCP